MTPDDVLCLRCEGPLQAWGETSRWVVRDTRLEPTKSGVVGMLAACLGWGLNDASRIAGLASRLTMATRADRPGQVLRDYHTIVGGVLAADGRVKVNAKTKQVETVVSWRDYLTDACFLVLLAGASSLLDQIEAGLRRPFWPPYLGRKSCPPGAPIFPALPGHRSRLTRTDLDTAAEIFPWLGRGQPPEQCRAIFESPAGVVPVDTLVQRRIDVPLVARRGFAHRYVYERQIPLIKSV